MLNKDMLDYLDRRMNGDRRSDREDGRRDYGVNYSGQMEFEKDHGDYRRVDSRYDGRGGNRNGFEDSMRDREDSRTDYRRDSRRVRDRRSPGVFLSKSDIKKWYDMMENTDGSRGAHYDMQQVMHAADKLGIRFDEYTEKEFCITVNMMYSDYGNIVKKYASSDKELMFCAEMARAFLEDPDSPEGSEKIALYYHCIVCSEDV